ncbi:MAG: hypothetical protein AAGC88_08140 [Bacteroidota bacterium]
MKPINSLHLPIICVVIAMWSSCEVDRKSITEEKASTNSSVELPPQVELRYAQNFSVSYHSNFKLVNLRYKSEVKEMNYDQRLVLIDRGVSKSKLPDSLQNDWIIEVPVKSVAANDDGEITRLKSLGLLDAIAGMGGGAIYDAELRSRWERKEIASIGYSFHSVPQPELLMSARADLLILHTFDNERLDGMEKLRKLGINAVPQFAWAEPDFLGKAEWLKYSALFFNKEKEATALFDSIVSRCHELMAKVDEFQTRQTSFLLYRPSDEADWKAHLNDFYSSYLQAVSNNVLKDNGPTHSVGITNEMLLNEAKDADFWIVNSTVDTDWPPANYLNSFKAYRTGNVYHYQKRTRHEHNAYDWYETPQVRPDMVLEDLVSIFYPKILPDHELIYLDKVELTKR